MAAILISVGVSAQSLDQIRSKANSGDAESLYLMGWSYANGANGAILNYSEALPWFKQASDKGIAAASYYLGWMYYYGEGVSKDNTEAYKWFTKSEQQGMSEAHTMALACKDGTAILTNNNKSSLTQPSKDNNFQGSKETSVEPAPQPSDVDNVPNVATKKAEKTFAVIIANEAYSKEASVPFSENDGKVFAEYCKNVLGLPEENIHLVTNATLNDMRHEIGWLSKTLNAFNPDGKAIFYYAGHGIPDEASKNAYLLPVDGYGSDVNTGYPLEQLYKDLGSVNSKEVVVLLDACFSGAKREGGMLASTRVTALKVNQGEPVGNVVVFSAAQGDETASSYKKEGHGLFTYYLLRELKDTKGNVTLKQLSDFVTDNVSKQSLIANGKTQTPTIFSSKSIANSWENWKLK